MSHEKDDDNLNPVEGTPMARTRDEAGPRLGDGTTGRPGLATAVLAGAVGGLYGAAAMSVLRLGLHRAGLMDKMVPQAVEEWISDRLNIDPPDRTAGTMWPTSCCI